MQLLNIYIRAGRGKTEEGWEWEMHIFLSYIFLYSCFYSRAIATPHREDFCLFLLSVEYIRVTTLSSVSAKNQTGENNMEENKRKYLS